MTVQFIWAESLAEAASRMFALSGQPRVKTRGPKRALVALARAASLDVDMEVTNAILGREIADKLGVPWSAEAETGTGQIALAGMNILLRGAVDALRRGSLAQTHALLPVTLAGWKDFRPARSKIEAVNRISALTHSGPQDLGPGGKERKSVLSDLAHAAYPEVDTSVNKTRLGEALADALHVPWSDACSSTGYTITLDGLNTILAGAERRLGLLGSTLAETFDTPQEEGSALAAALRDGLPSHWDGRECVREMRESEFPHWRQSEWSGWYNEFRGLPVLNDAFAMLETGGPRRRFGQTVFDYALGRVWDLKTHTERKLFAPSGRALAGGPTIILNDIEAARACVAAQGLGFLIVGGDSCFDDDGAFDRWHRLFTRRGTAHDTRPNSCTRRRRKSAFTPKRCEAFWVVNLSALDAAIAAGQLTVRTQGRQQARAGQSEGAARRDKLHINTSKAQALRVGVATWP